MSLIISNNVINLAHFQQKLDETIFDYIDTSANWDKASNLLEEMLDQTTAYFLKQVEAKGELPSATTYWVLFTDLNAKLLYFATLAMKNKSQRSIGMTDDVIAKRFETAAKCLSNIEVEENQLFLDEIEESYLSVESTIPFGGRLERTPAECIKLFYDFAKEY